jgi:DNA repair exonuclease SbcCD ATPase subunit
MKELQIKEARDSITIAHEINLIKEQTNKILFQSSIEIGKRLNEAKGLVGHGNWLNWLEIEVNYSERTAQNLIKIYEEYGLKSLGNSNPQPVADLGYTQAVAMLRLDFEERENFILENDVENMSKRKIEEAVREKNEILEEKKELQKQLNEITDKESSAAKELQKRVDEIAEYQERITNKALQVKELKDEIDKLKEAVKTNVATTDEAVDTEEIEKLQDELDAKDEELKKLKAQLKKKPEQVEVIPPEVEEKLEKLKAQLQASDGAVKFKATLEIIVSLFNELIELVDDMQESAPDEYEKYKGAVNKLLEKLRIE